MPGCQTRIHVRPALNWNWEHYTEQKKKYELLESNHLPALEIRGHHQRRVAAAALDDTGSLPLCLHRALALQEAEHHGGGGEGDHDEHQQGIGEVVRHLQAGEAARGWGGNPRGQGS